MRVGPLADMHPIAHALLAAAAERGLPVIDDANAESNEGAVYADYNAVVGDDGAFERWSTARAYLEPALGRADLDVLVGSRVHGLTVSISVVAGIFQFIDARLQATPPALHDHTAAPP